MKNAWNRLLGVLADTTSIRADPIRREVRIVLGLLAVAAQEWEGWDDSLAYERGSVMHALVAAREMVALDGDAVTVALEDLIDMLGSGEAKGGETEIVVKNLK
jgi:hypothetical protein